MSEADEQYRGKNSKQGVTGFQPTHGLRKIPEYDVWNMMKQRCYNPKVKKYKWYGAVGIRVCERWLSFANFIADMGRRPTPKHTLERKDRFKDYSPDNCTWATHAEQARNRGNVAMIEWGGKRLCAKDWAPIVGIKQSTILARIRYGWTAEEALTIIPGTIWRKDA